MAVKIRLQRKGRTKAPYYHIVIADARSPRDGKFIERLGFYNPTTVPASIDLDRDKAYDWLMKGAQPTDTVKAILKYKGIMYRKHLTRGVSKGAMTQEVADQMYQDWIQNKEGMIQSKIVERKEKMDQYHVSTLAVTRAPKVKEVVEETEVPAEIDAPELLAAEAIPTEDVVAPAETVSNEAAEEVKDTPAEG
ncbi:MAG: 30S ribosomal protein S16 [Saprospiraceae bacterium]|nr:30S ribosomal protein S16 [Saprospiraceae bacterium]